MRKVIAFLFVFCLLFAATAHAQEDVKVGVVSLGRVLMESEPGKKAQAELRRSLQPERDRIAEQDKALQSEMEELKKQAAVLSQDAKKEKLTAYQRKVYEHSNKMQQFQQKVAEEEERVLNPLKEKLVEIIQKYGQENKFDLILTDVSGGVVWASKRIDVTPDIMQRFNAAF
ncbi:OmpH family outer membrane protein [Oceanidesulfovibrio indonesiensis]|nr:OmpH family outer membrane protein [Oceanidesulfovibrio indonesiensis]